MKMEPIVSSETSAIRTQTPGNYPKRNKLHCIIIFPVEPVPESCGPIHKGIFPDTHDYGGQYIAPCS